jgi:hypothetical protein
MHKDHEVFVTALEELDRVKLTFVSKEDAGLALTRSCAPMDFGPSRRSKDKSDRYHFWDYDSDSQGGSHTLGLLPGQIITIEKTEMPFDPAEFITWTPVEWFYPRDWGAFS